MKTLCFISLMNSAPWGGSEELWYQTALFCLGQHYKVDCVVYEDEQKKQKLAAIEAAGGRVFYLPNKGKTKNGWQQKLQFKITKKLRIPRFLKTIPFEQYDHVVINQGEFELTYSTWKNLWQRLPAYTLLFHNYRETQTMSRQGVRRLRLWLRYAAVNLFASQRIPAVLEKLLQEAVPCAGILINPITFARPTAPKPWPPLQNGEFIFVMLAALDTSRKAQDLLIEALSAPQWQHRNWQLHLYGIGPDREKLLSLVQTKGMQHRVLLKEHTSQAEAVLSAAHLFCQMSKVDAMPISVVEAMACARPVLVSPIGDMPLWVNDEKNGFVSGAATVAAISQTLEKAWGEKEEWERIGKEGFRTFLQRYPENVPAYFLQQILDGVKKAEQPV